MFDYSMQENAIRIINEGAKTAMSNTEFIVTEIREFKKSPKYRAMINGQNYYDGKHDILNKKRTVIGEDGKLTEVTNLPNSKQVDNQYKKCIKQKVNYFVGKPFTVQCENEQYSDLLSQYFNNGFMRTIKNVCKDSLNGGIGWLYPYYDENGEFKFKKFKPYEIIAGWKDADHTELDYAIRVYDVEAYEGLRKTSITKVEYYTVNGIDFYELHDQQLIPCEPYHRDYFSIDNKSYNWTKIPLVAFKYSEEEIPLICNVKSLQDGLNTIISNFQDNMQEDMRNTILVLVNYDGTNLGEFRRNLATYGAVKIRNDSSGAGGDVKTLQIEVNAENYKALIDIFKKAIIENCLSYDAKDERMSGTPNQMNIQSMYNDIDLDANDMETEYQASMEELLWFINMHLSNTGQGDFEGESVEFIFNRDMMMNEGDVITNIQNSVGILSTETLIAQHPWVNDPQEEFEKLEAEKQKAMEQYGNAFGGDVTDDESDDDEV